MEMSERVYIEPLNEDHRLELGMALGISAAANFLRAKSENGFERLPGFNTALALVEAIEAQHRAEIAGKNIRAAAAAGYDISTHIVGLVGRAKIFVEPMDLEQLAEFAKARGDTPKEEEAGNG
jgi:hypothetical protein